ncbi:MAG: hypothetical protein ACRCTO_11675, partial [Pseudomonas paracarnis]
MAGRWFWAGQAKGCLSHGNPAAPWTSVEASPMWGACGEQKMERRHKRINSKKRRKLIAAYKLPGAP